MNTLALFVSAIGFGLAVAAPVGPMAILCMRRTLTIGWAHGIATGAGIAVGDGLYAMVAALGLSGVSAFVTAHEQLLHAGAGIFLLYLGLKSFLPRTSSDGTPREQRASGSVPMVFAGSVLLTLTNPPTIIMFAAIFAALAPASGFNSATAFSTVAGVFAGSLIWWCGLTAVVLLFRQAIGPRTRRWIDLIAGTMLTIFGVIEIRKCL